MSGGVFIINDWPRAIIKKMFDLLLSTEKLYDDFIVWGVLGIVWRGIWCGVTFKVFAWQTLTSMCKLSRHTACLKWVPYIKEDEYFNLQQYNEYPRNYAHGWQFEALTCAIISVPDDFTHIIQDRFTGNGVVIWWLECHWSNLWNMGMIHQNSLT